MPPGVCGSRVRAPPRRRWKARRRPLIWENRSSSACPPPPAVPSACILPQTDSDLLEQIIVTQLERRGFKLEQDSRGQKLPLAPAGHLRAASASSASIFSPIRSPPPSPPQHASDYTAALRLAQLPAGHLVIVEEQGDLVLAASHQGKLYHSHIFAQTPATEETLALEITLAASRWSLSSASTASPAWRSSVPISTVPSAPVSAL
jgi:hypothetical protein